MLINGIFLINNFTILIVELPYFLEWDRFYCIVYATKKIT